MNLARFTLLAHMVKSLPDKAFDLDWVFDADENEDTSNINNATPEAPCGAIGCVMGWAGRVPAFQALGFTTSVDGCLRYQGHGMAYDGFGAELLGIEEEEASMLFGGVFDREKAEFRDIDVDADDGQDLLDAAPNLTGAEMKTLLFQRMSTFLQSKGIDPATVLP